LPGQWQERSGLPPPLEHVVAYFCAAGLLAWAWPGSRRILTQVAGLVVLSATMEFLQNFSPGRDPRLADVIWSSLGAISGAVAASGTVGWRRRFRAPHDGETSEAEGLARRSSPATDNR